MATLPTNIDATYADDAEDESVQLHQEYHDVLHSAHNNVDVFSLDVEYINADHVIRKMQGGTYTPASDRIIVEVGYNGKYEGLAHMSTFFAWNQSVSAGTDLLTGESFTTGNQYVTGTTYETVGPAAGPGNSANTRRRILIEGLTPGTPMVWEVDIGVTGYREDISDGKDFPVQIAFNSNAEVMYATWFNSNQLVKYDPGNRWANDGVTSILAEWTVNGAYGVATNPLDDDVVYVSSNSDSAVYELDAVTGETLRTFTMGSSPLYMEVSNDGTKLFVGISSQAIQPIVLDTGTVQSSITVGGYGGQQKFRAIGDYIVVPCTTGERVDRITVSDGTVTTLAMPSGQFPRGVSAAKDDSTTFWVCTDGVDEVFEVNLADMTQTSTPVIPASAINGAPRDLAVSPTGQSLVMGTDTHFFLSYALPPEGMLYEEGTGSSMSFIAKDRVGGVWIVRQTSDYITHFHGAMITLDPANEFWGSYSDVFIEEK